MSNIQDIWSNMLTTLEIEASAIQFDVWLKPLEPVEIIDNKLVLLASSSQARDFIASRFSQLLKTVLTKYHTLLNEVEIIDPQEMERFSTRVIEKIKEEKKPVSENITLRAQYTFDSFVVGKSNEFAFATAQAIAEDPGSKYNPLFIYGGAGLGKTHIMHAIGNKIRSTKNLKVMYVSSDKFINEFIEGIRTGSANSNSFKEKYRSVDALMIDDVQFFAGKEATQEEFFHTFNDLHQSGKQIVMTSDRPPKEIGGLPDRLRSRFESGIIADISPPDLETRIAILQRKAQADGIDIPIDVIEYIAERISNNVRELEGVLNKVVLFSKVQGTPPSIDMVKDNALKDYDEKTTNALTIEEIIESVSRYCNVQQKDILSTKRPKELVEARQFAMYLCTELLTSTPLASIGKYFNRDHTTVMHARDKITQKLEKETKMKLIISDIKDLINKSR